MALAALESGKIDGGWSDKNGTGQRHVVPPLADAEIIDHRALVAAALPRGARVATTQNGSLQEIITGPARENDGTFNLMGALRTSMATCGYRDIAEFNRAELMIAPSLQSEGKQLQRDQAVGMGARGGAMALAATE